MKKYEVEGHAPSLLPEGKKWKLVWSDEFDGDTLDRSKWGFRLGLMQTRHETYTTEGVSVHDGCLHIELVEKDGQYYSAQLQTGANYMDNPPGDNGYEKFNWPVAPFEEQRFLKKYGYFECRCKLQRQPGWWSAFWLQSPIIGCCADPGIAGVEIDVMESFEPGTMIKHCLHYNGYGKDYKNASVTMHEADTFAVSDDWHVCAVEWSPEGYNFYIDGEFDGHLDGPVSHTPQFILLSTECKGYRKGNTPDPQLKEAVLPDAFIVDYVRVYDEIQEGEE